MAAAEKSVGVTDINYYIYDYLNRCAGLKDVASLLKEKAKLVSVSA